MKPGAVRLTTVLVLASLSIVGRLSLVWLPNVSLSYLALAVAGLAYGVRVGASVGFLGRLGSDLLISGLNPILLPMTLVESLLGATLGICGKFVRLGRRPGRPTWWTRLILFDLGVALTLAYSVIADLTTWTFYNLVLSNAPDAARNTFLLTLIIAGLAFSILPAIIHGLLFAAALPPIFRGLHEAGLVREHPPQIAQNSVETTGLPRGP